MKTVGTIYLVPLEMRDSPPVFFRALMVAPPFYVSFRPRCSGLLLTMIRSCLPSLGIVVIGEVMSLWNQVYSSQNGYIVLISPANYFDETTNRNIKEQKLILGRNALVYYEGRNDWIDNPPKKYGWEPAQNRKYPLGGQYVARIPATTAHSDGRKINEGFTGTDNKGAGIRVYEYASQQTINESRLQLEAIFWTCRDAIEHTVFSGMTKADAILRKKVILENCERRGLFDQRKLFANRILNGDNVAICPFCLEELGASGFFSRLKQASGREVNDLTVTELNLFHIDALRVGTSNHRPYNLGWGHHHCNIVVKDEGIEQTLQWLQKVLSRNDTHKSSAG